MTAKHLTLAAALIAVGIGGAAHARSPQNSVTATYQADTKRFCVRAQDLDTAELIGTRIYQRRCLTERQWLEQGIHFVLPKNFASIAKAAAVAKRPASLPRS